MTIRERWPFLFAPKPRAVFKPPTLFDRLYGILGSGWRPIVKTHDYLERGVDLRIWWKVDAYPMDAEVRKRYGHIVGAVCETPEEALVATEGRIAQILQDIRQREGT